MRELGRWARRWTRRQAAPERLTVWYDPSFRLPIPSLGPRHGLEPRRSDFVAWVLTIERWLSVASVQSPAPVRYADLARVHTESLLTALTDGGRLAEVYHSDPHAFPTDEVMLAVRRACGATLEGARLAVAKKHRSLSLLGGFHHAFPDKAGGLCPVNDIAVAIFALRSQGFSGQVVILDLDAHPPDGTAACLAGDPRCWIGSLSGSDWGPLPGVDETVLPPGSGDDAYLGALDRLLGRMPRPELAFVIAGGDVLAEDRLGQLGLSEGGARRRDHRVLRALGRCGSVWLPGGGYSERAWRVLAGTGLVLLGHAGAALPDLDPMDLQFNRIAQRLDPVALTGQDDPFDLADLEEELGVRRRGAEKLLGHYTREGLLVALQAYGLLGHLERLGYHGFRVEIAAESAGERMRVLGRDATDEEHVLGEVVLERRRINERSVVFVHWLTLRHPLAQLGRDVPALPGQEVPGLGLSPEAVELLAQAAKRVGAEGVAFQPSYFHTAWAPGGKAVFVDEERQRRFAALIRDLSGIGRLALSQALSDERVRLNGEVYRWEPDLMVEWLDGAPPPAADPRDLRFTLDPALEA
jgi:acetoin utilization deacetylase AcuC-like enzyme